MTENRPTTEPTAGSGEALLLDTWKRPMVVGWLGLSVSETSLDRRDERWRVFSGLEGEEDEEEVEDDVEEAEETTLDGPGARVGASSGGTEICRR